MGIDTSGDRAYSQNSFFGPGFRANASRNVQTVEPGAEGPFGMIHKNKVFQKNVVLLNWIDRENDNIATRLGLDSSTVAILKTKAA